MHEQVLCVACERSLCICARILTTSTRPLLSLRWLTRPGRVHPRHLTSPRPPRYAITAFADQRMRENIRSHARTPVRMHAACVHAYTDAMYHNQAMALVATQPPQIQPGQWASLRPRRHLFVANISRTGSKNWRKCPLRSFSNFAAAPALVL